MTQHKQIVHLLTQVLNKMHRLGMYHVFCGQDRHYKILFKLINSCANVQTCIALAKSALDANLNLAMLHCPKCKVMHIDTPNSGANIKH